MLTLGCTHIARAVTFTVSNTNDSGAGSLRQAITNANATPDADTIVVNIPGSGQKTLTVASALPLITQPLIVDGANRGDRFNRLEIRNGGSAGIAGLSLKSVSNCEVGNLVINGFSDEILLDNVTNTTISGSVLGIDPDVTNIVAGSGRAIHIRTSSGVYIGYSDVSHGNILSSINQEAILIESSTVTIKGNDISLIYYGAAGIYALGNPSVGIQVSNDGPLNVTIGGGGTNEPNRIAAKNGIVVGALGQAASTATIEYNYIGADPSSDTAFNRFGESGILLRNAVNVAIRYNLISGNGEGITLGTLEQGASCSGTVIQGNGIGVSGNFYTPLFNNRNGINVVKSASDLIGDPTGNLWNVIAFNGGDGIRSTGGVRTRIQGNRIYGNSGLAIDLNGDGVTPNDADDRDGGANLGQNFPVISSFTSNGGNLFITGKLNSAANTTYRLEFFYADIEPSRHGEAIFFLGFANATTDASGNAFFNVRFPQPSPQLIAPYKYVTATATDPNGNASEFSAVNGAPYDFNRDSTPDFVLFHAGTRRTAVWYMNNATFLRGAFAPTLPAGWKLVGVADFDGDDNPDYFLFNPSTRRTAIWYLQGTTFVRGEYAPSIPSGWEPVTLGVLIDNPKFVLYSSRTRQTQVWHLSRTIFGDLIAGFDDGPILPANWKLVGLADFNLDYSYDYLLYNTATRQTAIWYLRSFGYSKVTFLGGAYGPAIANGYSLVGACDFNGDAKPDYILYNSSTRRTAVWYLDNNVLKGGSYGPTLPVGWSLEAP